MPDTKKLIETVALILEEREPPTQDALRKIVEAQAAVVQMTDGDGSPYSTDQINETIKTTEESFSIRMRIGNIFQAEDYHPWLKDRQGDISWFYSERYKKHLLTTKKFPPHVVRTLDRVTDKILDHLEDPQKEGDWSRRGLVVGHVQSGKTANYTGVICKAADAGYKVIIVLAGLLNTLRNQTQERIDSDFMGWCTRHEERIGASRFSPTNRRRPVCLTTVTTDFNKETANNQIQLAALNEPIVVVLKKNKHSLERLHQWLSGQNEHDLREFPMLMIDDEADHASVNTNKDEKDPTTINRAIRDLLKLFNRSSYVGYTATPFANIFIDPENEDEMTDGDLYKDLFPRDFILSLDPPDNYVGPHKIFTGDGNTVRSLDDNEDYIPIKHDKTFTPDALPPSMKRAIECFVIAKAIRLLRGQKRKHHSMMINVSRFTNVQNLLWGLVYEHIKKLRNSINNYSGLYAGEALKNSCLSSLHSTWEVEYSDLEFTWDKIQPMLKSSIDPVGVISVNSSKESETLDYSEEEYPNGRSVIAIGGLGLSRGLTLEGLMVSYFLRN